MATLNQQQIDFFWSNGYLVAENAVDESTLSALRSDFSQWVDDSRSHTEAFGEAIDGRARFDVEAGHSAEVPALRRVNAPVEISQAYYQAMAQSRMSDMVADLIGPNVKFHHSKINSKLPGGKTAVKWHQDF
ncbi:MAG: phytanoyl-CoA dioxygenase family protein, partial [Pseudomonadota bacterium]